MADNLDMLLGSLQEKLEIDDIFDEERHDDYFLTRFLVARNYKLNDAYEMIAKYEVSIAHVGMEKD
jgi:hypothetical protein